MITYKKARLATTRLSNTFFYYTVNVFRGANHFLRFVTNVSTGRLEWLTHFFSDAAGQYVRKTCAAMSRHGNQVGVDAVGKVSNAFLLAHVVEYIDGIVCQL